MTTLATLDRATFTISRALEFFTEKELGMQIGHERTLWPLALVKELIDNALDACESTGTSPEITITVKPNLVMVRDNGPGLPETTLYRSLDYFVRVSDKAAYVSPTRGQLGNALKCAWAAPFVIDGEQGRIDVATGGIRYRIDITLDRIKQAPRISVTRHPSVVKTGTEIRLSWPGVASYLDGSEVGHFYNTNVADVVLLLRCYAACNPHGRFAVRLPDDDDLVIEPTQPSWSKWLPSSPTDPHWYTVERLRSLIAAYVANEQDGGRARTVREFIAEFAGLAGTAKQKAVTTEAGLTGAALRDLVHDDDVDEHVVDRLLRVMQSQARALKPVALGILGEAHLRRVLTDTFGAAPASIRIKKFECVVDDLPYVIEAGFGINDAHCADFPREIAVMLNWSPALGPPIPQIAALLGECRVDRHDPVALVLHIACPRFEYVDRGKTRLVLPAAVQTDLAEAIRSVTKNWKRAKRQADRQDRVQQRELEDLRRSQRRRQWSIKEAAYAVMEQAYRQASGSTGLALARQIMYAARPLVLDLTGGTIWKHDSYFTQTLLPDFIDEHPDLTAGWDVVYDARGHLVEPHSGRRVPLGTLEVRQYIADWQRGAGPQHRYNSALFVEKEGFSPLLERMQIAERFDLAIMSTKGVSVIAARELIDHLSQRGVTILVVRDFDKSGFTIARTIAESARRYQFTATPKVIDLGLRLTDVQAMGLISEPVEYHGAADPRFELRRCGATAAEREFLVRHLPHGGWIGERVELNAMASDQFIAWLEEKLIDHGVRKVVPDAVTLAEAYINYVQESRRQSVINAAIARALENYVDPDVAPPVDLREHVMAALPTGAATETWREAVADLADEFDEDASPIGGPS
ncbi:MAG: ATP-binding protein [Dehalococcoidia bacterium]